MDRHFQLTEADRRQLVRIAALIDAEAETWREGSCVYGPQGWVWTDRSPEAQRIHVRVVKLENAIRFLRGLARADLLGPTPRMEAAVAAE